MVIDLTAAARIIPLTSQMLAASGALTQQGPPGGNWKKYLSAQDAVQQGKSRGGIGTFEVDRKVVSTQTLDHTVPLTLPWDETFDIGADTGTPVDDQDYQVPFTFTGKIDKLTISLEPPKLTEEDKQKLQAAYQAAQDAR